MLMARHHDYRRDRGYTLIEMLATMSILAIATALAVPNMRDFMQNNRAANEANALIGAFSVARNEAVTRGIRVGVCASTNGTTCGTAANWVSGWIVFTDADSNGAPDDVLRVYDALGPGSTLLANYTGVSYQPNGFLFLAKDDPQPSFDLQVPHCAGNNNRSITINLQGRPSVAHVACKVVVED